MVTSFNEILDSWPIWKPPYPNVKVTTFTTFKKYKASTGMH